MSNPKVSAGALRAQTAIRKLLASAYLYPEHDDFDGTVAEIIDRETGVAALLEAAKVAYVKLADISFQWLGRSSPEGQSLLCKLRDGIAKAQGQDEEEVQSWAVQQAISKCESGTGSE